MYNCIHIKIGMCILFCVYYIPTAIKFFSKLQAIFSLDELCFFFVNLSAVLAIMDSYKSNRYPE